MSLDIIITVGVTCALVYFMLDSAAALIIRSMGESHTHQNEQLREIEQKLSKIQQQLDAVPKS